MLAIDIYICISYYHIFTAEFTSGIDSVLSKWRFNNWSGNYVCPVDQTVIGAFSTMSCTFKSNHCSSSRAGDSNDALSSSIKPVHHFLSTSSRH